VCVCVCVCVITGNVCGCLSRISVEIISWLQCMKAVLPNLLRICFVGREWGLLTRGQLGAPSSWINPVLCAVEMNILCAIWGSNSAINEVFCLLGCNACRYFLTSLWFIARFIVLIWKGRRHIPPKRQLTMECCAPEHKLPIIITTIIVIVKIIIMWLLCFACLSNFLRSSRPRRSCMLHVNVRLLIVTEILAHITRLKPRIAI
jgi:hypothetical protein